MEAMQTTSCHREDGRCKAITALIDSVADQQAALAQILEEEHRKVEKVVEMCNTDLDDLVRIDQSVERVISAITRLELAMQLKLDLFRGCLCPEDGCGR